MVSGSVSPAWRKLFELFSELCRQEDTNSVLNSLMREIGDIIPIDHGIALNEMRNGIPYCFQWPEYADELVPDFNAYYNIHCPVDYDWNMHTLGPISWKRYQHTKYDTDFNRPLNLGHSIGMGCRDPLSGNEMVLVLHRSRGDTPFSECDLHTLELIRPLFARLFALQRFTEKALMEELLPAELRSDHSILSPREREVAQLLVHRISMREIAARLSISPRTVERHALHIYQKLRVNNRKQLATLLLNTSDDTA